MKRDYELIRQILLKVEEANNKKELEVLSRDGISGYSYEIFQDHVNLMFTDLEFINVKSFYGEYKVSHYQHKILCLTNRGYDFLDKIRDDEIWNKALKVADSKGLDILRYTLEGIIKRKIDCELFYYPIQPIETNNKKMERLLPLSLDTSGVDDNFFAKVHGN